MAYLKFEKSAVTRFVILILKTEFTLCELFPITFSFEPLLHDIVLLLEFSLQNDPYYEGN